MRVAAKSKVAIVAQAHSSLVKLTGTKDTPIELFEELHEKISKRVFPLDIFEEFGFIEVLLTAVLTILGYPRFLNSQDGQCASIWK